MAQPSLHNTQIETKSSIALHLSVASSRRSDFKGNKLQQFGRVDDSCPGYSLREVPFVARDKEVNVPREGDELIVIRIRRNGDYWDWLENLPATLEHREQGINIFCREPKPWPKEDTGVLFENL